MGSSHPSHLPPLFPFNTTTTTNLKVQQQDTFDIHLLLTVNGGQHLVFLLMLISRLFANQMHTAHVQRPKSGWSLKLNLLKKPLIHCERFLCKIITILVLKCIFRISLLRLASWNIGLCLLPRGNLHKLLALEATPLKNFTSMLHPGSFLNN